MPQYKIGDRVQINDQCYTIAGEHTSAAVRMFIHSRTRASDRILYSRSITPKALTTSGKP